MYFNELHLLYYIAFGVIGLIIGKITDNYNQNTIMERSKQDKKKPPEEEKTAKQPYLVMLITAVLYIILLYCFGLKKELINNLQLFQYLILTSFLISTIIIDIKIKIIPNRLVLTMLDIGIIFAFIYGMYDLNIALNRLIGGIVGITIFVILSLIGKLISDKETMGFGDVKFAGVLGLYFGFPQIMILSVLSFVIGAVVSVILVIIKRKNMNEYIAFGPFISISSFILMIIPFTTIMNVAQNIYP